MSSKAGLVGLSADAWFAWDKESAWGVPVSPSASSEYALFLRESLTSEIPLVDVPNISAAFKDKTQVVQGAEVVAGEVQVALTYQGMENLLLHCFGEISSAGAVISGTYQRYFDLSKKGRFRNAAAKSLTMHISRGVVGSGNSNPLVQSYSGCVIDSFTLSCRRDEPVKLSMNVIGRRETAALSSVTPSFPTSPLPTFPECAITWGSGSLFVEEWSITAKRNIDRDRVSAGDLYISEPPPGQWEVTCNLLTEWSNEPLNSTATMRDDYRAGTARDLEIVVTSTSNIYLTSQKYIFGLGMAAAKIKRFPNNVTGRGRVKVPVEITGYATNGGTSAPRELRGYSFNTRNFADN